MVFFIFGRTPSPPICRLQQRRGRPFGRPFFAPDAAAAQADYRKDPTRSSSARSVILATPWPTVHIACWRSELKTRQACTGVSPAKSAICCWLMGKGNSPFCSSPRASERSIICTNSAAILSTRCTGRDPLGTFAYGEFPLRIVPHQPAATAARDSQCPARRSVPRGLQVAQKRKRSPAVGSTVLGER